MRYLIGLGHLGVDASDGAVDALRTEVVHAVLRLITQHSVAIEASGVGGRLRFRLFAAIRSRSRRPR